MWSCQIPHPQPTCNDPQVCRISWPWRSPLWGAKGSSPMSSSPVQGNCTRKKFSQGLTLKNNKQQSWHTGETKTALEDLVHKLTRPMPQQKWQLDKRWVTRGASPTRGDWRCVLGAGWRATFRGRQCASSAMGKPCAAGLTSSAAHLSTFFWGSSSQGPHLVDEKTERMSADFTEHGFSIGLPLENGACVCPWRWRGRTRGVCMCTLSHFSRVWLFVTPWTVACQVPLSTGVSRQEH